MTESAPRQLGVRVQMVRLRMGRSTQRVLRPALLPPGCAWSQLQAPEEHGTWASWFHPTSAGEGSL
jgi:hypothetical protein